MEPSKEVKFENLEEVNMELCDINTEVVDYSQEHEDITKIEHDLVKIEHDLEYEIINAEYENKIKFENNTFNMRTTVVPVPNAGHVVENNDQNEMFANESSPTRHPDGASQRRKKKRIKEYVIKKNKEEIEEEMKKGKKAKDLNECNKEYMSKLNFNEARMIFS